VDKEVKANSRVLIVGGGFSSTSAQLALKSEHVFDIDISDYSVREMDQLLAQVARIKFMKMDVRDLGFPNDVFDLIFDKGTCKLFFLLF